MYLSKIEISNYKGIEYLKVDFSPDINIIIGENGKNKTALIDAIRILYNIGKPNKDISITEEDFFINTETGIAKSKIEITYIFRDLSDEQKGAFYEFIVFSEKPQDTYAKVVISYEKREDKFPMFNYTTGIGDAQKADFNTFELFKHYYLGALRDSTKDLLNTRSNILGSVIKQAVVRAKTEEKYTTIIDTANQDLLKQPEVNSTKTNINEKLIEINKYFKDEQIGLQISPTNITYILNSIKPFLPYNKSTLTNDGFNLRQNSLGFNNMIYIATVLSDINEKTKEDSLSHFALLIEEPEAHLHPQLQLNLYNFLRKTNNQKNSQLFITSHSPTLTSKVKFKNLILLDDYSYRIDNCFKGRVDEEIIEDTKKKKKLKTADFKKRAKQLERYIDVTKSQLFFSKGILLVEGISEELLIPAFCNIKDFSLDDYQIELVNVNGTSFYPFIHLFNSTKSKKRIPKRISILTDEDQFPDSNKSKYSFKELIANDYAKLDELYEGIKDGTENNRVNNLMSVKNEIEEISIQTAMKTFEFKLAHSNVIREKSKFKENLLVEFIDSFNSKKIKLIEDYIETLEVTDDKFNREQRFKIALLLWKTLPSKSDFAQDFALYLLENISRAKTSFKIPQYIKQAISHLTQEDV
jgi:putative ATP-dependent endonuclease of OLD family